jgi:hypothetical protein
MNKARELDATLLEALTALLGDRVTTSRGVREHHGKDESYYPYALPDAVEPSARALESSPALRGTGRLSPVNSASSICVVPDSTHPSAGNDSPGLTRTRSPVRSAAAGFQVGADGSWPTVLAPGAAATVSVDFRETIPIGFTKVGFCGGLLPRISRSSNFAAS